MVNGWLVYQLLFTEHICKVMVVFGNSTQLTGMELVVE